MNQPAPIEFVYLFEYGSYLSWLLLVGFFFFYKKERIVQWFIIAMTLSFPMEWLADNYWMFLNYDSQFTPMIGHFPLFMPFSWGWFFGLVIAVSLGQKTRLDQYSRLVQGLIIFAAFFAWDTLVESLATSVNLWVYWWGAESFIPGTRLPIWIPLFTALQTPAFYFTAVWAKERYANAVWWHGFTPVFGVLVLSQAIEAIHATRTRAASSSPCNSEAAMDLICWQTRVARRRPLRSYCYTAVARHDFPGAGRLVS